MATFKNPGTWVLAPDLHYPLVHWPTFNAMMDFISKNEIAGFIFLGDMHDNAEISHFNTRRIIFREPGSYARNTKGFEDRILTPVENALTDAGTVKIWIDGNHDFWCNQLIEEQPELKGTMERPLLYKLEERGWTVIPTGKGFDIGKLHAMHGETLKGGNYTKTASANYAQSVVFAHFHSVQAFTKVLPQSHKDKWIAQSLPAMCTTNPVYLRNAPHAWVSGFGIVEVDDKANFNCYAVVVTDGKFRYGGVTYGETKK